MGQQPFLPRQRHLTASGLLGTFIWAQNPGSSKDVSTVCLEGKPHRGLWAGEQCDPCGEAHAVPLVIPSQYIKGSGRAPEGLMTNAWSDRTRGNGIELAECRVG